MESSLKEFARIIGIDDFSESSKRLKEFLEEVSMPRAHGIERMKILPYVKQFSEWFPTKSKEYPRCQEIVQAKPDASVFEGIKSAVVTAKTPPRKNRVSEQEVQEDLVEMLSLDFKGTESIDVRWPAYSRIRDAFYESIDSQFDMAVSIGDTLCNLVGSINFPVGISPWLVAGFLKNKGIEMANCLTENLAVPAESDFVLGGYIDRNEFKKSGAMYPVMHITGISGKKDATVPKSFDNTAPDADLELKELEINKNRCIEQIILNILRITVYPEIEDIAFADGGLCKDVVIVKLSGANYKGKALRIAHALWGSSMFMLNKVFVIVREYPETFGKKLNIRNAEEVKQQILKNYIPRANTYFTRGLIDERDTSAPQKGFGGKMCIDAMGAISALPFDNEEADLSKISCKSNLISYISRGENIPKNSAIVIVVDNKERDSSLACVTEKADAIADTSFIGEGLTASLVIKA
ncbi:MAG: UbiD family decarboxylase [Bacteroidales bacterium]